MNSAENVTIARVIARLNVGGPAVQAILMTDVFRRKGYKALLLTGEVSPGESSMEYLAEAREVTPIKISTLSRRISFFRDILTLCELIRTFRRETPTIVHTHTAKAGTLGRVAAILTRVPICVHTFHGHVFSGYFSPLATRVFLTIERFLARHTDCIVALSESQRRDLTEVYKVAPAEKVTTIALGFDLDPFLAVDGYSGALRDEFRTGKQAPLVGWVGRLTGIKSPKTFVNCAGLLKDHPLCPRFVMVGDGEMRQDCEQSLERDGLRNVCFLTGFRRDLPAIYADLDFVVATSLNEGTPIALLEAMASGKAIISTDVGGVRDLMLGAAHRVDGIEVFQNGILVGRDVRQLARAVTYLLEQPACARAMGEKGREFVMSRFSYHRLANDLEQLYQSLRRAKLSSKQAVICYENEPNNAILSPDGPSN